MINVKVGQDVTLVSKGVVNGYGSPYVDSLLVGQTSFMRVTKIGTKYLYGVHFWMEDGVRKDAYYEGKVDIEKYQVFEGEHMEFKMAYDKFRLDVDDYEKRYAEVQRQLEWEMRQELNKKFDAWKQANPRPVIITKELKTWINEAKLFGLRNDEIINAILKDGIVE